MKRLLLALAALALALPGVSGAVGTYIKGEGGGVVLVTESTLPAVGDSTKTYRITNATDAADCLSGSPGTARADCRWNGSGYEAVGVAATGLTNPLVAPMEAAGNPINSPGNVDGRDVSGDGAKLDGVQAGATVGPTYDAVVDISDRTTACQNWATVVEDFMDGSWNASRGYYSKYRILVKGTPSSPIRIATDTYDESGTWPYDSCFMLHPQNADSDTGVWPDSNGAEALLSIFGPYGGTMEITMATGAIKVDQTSMDKNACLFDFGNGYLAGKTGNDPFGMLGGTVKVKGQTQVVVSTTNISGYTGGGQAGEGIPENSATARLNKWSTTSFSPFCAFGASYVDMSEWEFGWVTDADDIGLWMAESWGSKGPRIASENYVSGVGMQFYGFINNDMQISDMRGGDYGIVLGGGDPADKSLWYSSGCASGSCTPNTTRGSVIGPKIWGGVVEGQRHQLLTLIDASASINIGHGTYWECGPGVDCLAGGWGIRPALCDGTGTTPGARGRPAKSDTETSDCACLDLYSNVATPQTTGSPDGLCDYNRTITRVADADADPPQAFGDWTIAALDGNPMPQTIGTPDLPNVWIGPGADDDLAIVISNESNVGYMDPGSAGSDALAPFKASSALTCGSGAGCAQIWFEPAEGTSQAHANAPANTPHVDYGGFVRFHPRGVKLTNTRLEIPGGDTPPTPCEGTEVWFDTNANPGHRFLACESGTFAVQGGVFDGVGVAAAIAFYLDSDTLSTDTGFSYNNTTNTLTAGIVVGSSALVAGSTTADGNLQLWDNSTNFAVNLWAGDQAADLDYFMPNGYGTAGYQLTTGGDGSLTWAAAGTGGGGGFIDSGAIVETQTPTDDFAVGWDGAGTGVGDWALYMDESTGELRINVPGGRIYIEPDATLGGCLSVSEGADDGGHTASFCMPDGATLAANTSVDAIGPNGKFTGGAIEDAAIGATQLAPNAAGNDELAATLTECFPLYSQSGTIADTDDITSLWRAPYAVTVTEVWCETDTGTVTADMQIDDGTPADIMGTDLVCDATSEVDSTSLSGAMASGDRLDLSITSVASSPKRATFCVQYNYN